MSEPQTGGDRIDSLIAEYLKEVAAGRSPDRAGILKAHPDRADELKSFFADHDRMHRFAEPATAGLDQAGTEGTPDVPGYQILAQLGRGGMGEVWLAEQRGAIHRRVALKVIRADADSVGALARFEAERQALAMMAHPNIAKVFDAGTTPAGRPYFVMELVQGVPITKFCDDARLSLRERVQLFLPICRAVQHAHTKGIIHRDLKPTNILVALVDGVPVPKVIDFGLAKALYQRLTERTLHTQFGAVVGTPEYMAPEQADFNSLDIDTRADIYSLGVILYELLAGSPPFSRKLLEGAALLEILRLIKETEPPSPSKRLSSASTLVDIATRRKSDPQKLGRLVRGELDWIVMKALEKERSRRYATADVFATDLEHYLNDEPILASPPSAVYRLRKTYRRHKGRIIAAGLLFLTLVAGLIATTTQAYRATRAEGDLRTSLVNESAATVRANEAAKEAIEQSKRASQEAEAAKKSNEKNRELLSAANVQVSQKHFQDGAVYLARTTLEDVAPEHRGWGYHYLKRHFQGGYVTLHGHSAFVHSVAFSPDGTRLASGSRDRSIKVWDARTGREELTLRGHTSYVTTVAFSPDGARLASGSLQTIRLWDTQTGREELTLRGHTGGIRSVAFSPDGARLASGSEDSTIKVWDTRTGREELTLRGHTSLVWSVAFSPDGTQLASGSEDNTIKVWDARTWREELTLRGHTGRVESIAFSPDGARLASGSYDNTIKVWDARTWREKFTLRGNTNGVLSVAFSPDGARLASGNYDNTIRVWATRSGREELTLRGHVDSVNSVAFSPDGARLASGSWDQTIKLWDAQAGREELTMRGHTEPVTCVAFSPDGAGIASGSNDQTIRLWNAHTGKEELTLRGHTDPVTTVAYSPDGARLASGSWDQTIKLWDARAGREELTLLGHTGIVRSIAFSPDGARLASGSDDTTIRVWDARTGREELTLRGHNGGVTSVAFSLHGARLASGSADQTIRLWNAHSGQGELTLRGHTYPVTTVSFSPDGARLASGSVDNTTKVWDARTGREELTLRGHTSYVTTVAFSPDGARLASGSDDTTIRVWDARTGLEELTLRGHNGVVRSVAFSPDNARLASGSDSAAIKLWDARTGREELTLRGCTGFVWNVAFSPDGTRLVSVSSDETARLWDWMAGNVIHQWPFVTREGDKHFDTTIAFDKYGHRLRIKAKDDVVYDVVSGFRVEQWLPADFVQSPDSARRPDSKMIALSHLNDILLVDLSDPLKWELDFYRAKARPDPWWHAEQFRVAVETKDAFAAAFHYRWLTATLPIVPLPAVPFGLPLLP